MALSLGEWGVNVKQDTNDYRRKPPFDKPWTLYIFVRVFSGGRGGGSWVEGFKFGKRKLSSVVNTTNHIEIKPRWGVVGGGGGGNEEAYNRNKETSYNSAESNSSCIYWFLLSF